MNESTNNSTFRPETIGGIMSTAIPTCYPHDNFGTILHQISSKNWESIDTVYVVNANKKLLGYIDMTSLSQSDHKTLASSIMLPVRVTLPPHSDQEKAVFLAIKNDVISIPVIDKEAHFLGAVSAHKIINVMHDEHVEDTLLTVGVHSKGSSVINLVSLRVGLVVRSRAPWLIIGLVVGLGLGFISSWFEEYLTKTIAIAYFIPVVAYIADSVGTQSEAITVRALAVTKVNYLTYLFKELVVGLMLGIIVGVLGSFGAALIAKSFTIGVVVGLSLLVASTVASVLASLIPIIFKILGKDPALGSGPLATALQDVISVVVYFLFAITLIK